MYTRALNPGELLGKSLPTRGWGKPPEGGVRRAAKLRLSEQKRRKCVGECVEQQTPVSDCVTLFSFAEIKTLLIHSEF